MCCNAFLLQRLFCLFIYVSALFVILSWSVCCVVTVRIKTYTFVNKISIPIITNQKRVNHSPSLHFKLDFEQPVSIANVNEPSGGGTHTGKTSTIILFRREHANKDCEEMIYSRFQTSRLYTKFIFIIITRESVCSLTQVSRI